MKTRLPSAPMVPLAPDGLPLLTGGRHASPGDGACFMEFASVLAGESFSDHPRCTHQLLAEIARRVNDNVDDAIRQRLLPLVPTVVGLRDGGPAVTAAIVADATLAALAVQSGSRRMRTACRRATRRGRATGLSYWWALLTDPAYRRGAGMRAVIGAVDLIHPDGPDALQELLSAAITAAREAQPAGEKAVHHKDGRARRSNSPRVGIGQ